MPVPPDSRFVVSWEVLGIFVQKRKAIEEQGEVKGRRTVLNQTVETLLDGKRRIEDDESEAEGQDIVGVTGLEEIANGTLFAALVKIRMEVIW
jgi:hypothetical protein